MKKIIFILLVAVSSLIIFTACSGSNASKGGAKDVIVIRAGYENNPGEPFDLGMQKWAEILEKKSGGTMKLELFPSSQLGSKVDLIDQMIAGEAVVTLADGAFFADRGVKDFGIVFGPFLFDSWEDCWKFIESDWYKEQSKKVEEKGLKILFSNWKYGERHTLTVKPVNKVEDLKGMKIRTPNNTIQVKGFEVLGARPTPMALGEVYTALQQKAIDGLENPVPVLYNGKFHEVAKNLILDGHVKNFTVLTTGTKFFNTLTKEQQDWFIESGKEAGVYQNEEQDKAFASNIEKFKAEGVTVVVPSQEVLDGFAKRAQAFYSLPEITKDWSPNLYETVKKAMK